MAKFYLGLYPATLTATSSGDAPTVRTTDGSQSDVQAKIDISIAGDTVEIPSGSFTWTAGITCSKAITIRGAGGGRVEGSSTTSLSITNAASRTFTLSAGSWITGFTAGETVRARVKYNSGNWMQGTVSSWDPNARQLVISMSSSSGSGTFAAWVFEVAATTTITCNAGASSLMTLTNPSSGVMHLEGLRISQGTGTADVLTINDSSSSGVVLIHDNRFSGGAVRLIAVKTNQGVVYKNYFDAGFDWDNAPNNLVSGSGIANKHAITSSWTTADTMGDRDTTGKSNFYVEENFFTGFTTECSDFDDNSRTVWRYNVMDNSGLTSHGQDTSSYGARHFEVYNNVFIFNDLGSSTANMNYLQYWRGGSGIWTDNTVVDITSSEWGNKGEVTLTVQQLRRNAGPNACWNSGYPSPRQPGQGHNGTTTTTEGVYIWNNTGATISVGLEDYSPDECSGGPAVSTYLQQNRDYFLTAKSGYSKYAYPHPLRTDNIFPLEIHSSGRYLIDVQGDPFFVHGDTAWSLAVQLTQSEVDTYLDDRQAKGFNAILFNAIEHEYSDNTPPERNANGDLPFTSTDDFGATNDAYWDHVDYIVNAAKARGMLCIINPAYLGFGGGSQGWTSEINAESAGDLQSYGAFLANRYTQGNVMWCLGGDYDGDATLRAKQRNIQTGIRSVRTTDLMTFHPNPNKHALEVVSTADYPNFVNWSYAYEKDGEYPFEQIAAAYAVSGPVPVIFMEGNYENEFSVTAAALRRQSYSSILAGACGQLFGNNPIWLFDTGWEAALGSTGSTQQQYVADLFLAYEWWKLAPQTGSSLVTSSKGSGTSPVCPALASDGTFAMIYVPSPQTVTVNKAALTPSNIRIRLYDTTAGTYSTHTASTTNTGTTNVATGGERVIVIDAA